MSVVCTVNYLRFQVNAPATKISLKIQTNLFYKVLKEAMKFDIKCGLPKK